MCMCMLEAEESYNYVIILYLYFVASFPGLPHLQFLIASSTMRSKTGGAEGLGTRLCILSVYDYYYIIATKCDAFIYWV